MRIIGDVHGNMDDYLNIASEAEMSIQIGDLGFDYSRLKRLHPRQHKFIGGNHDNYDLYEECPNAMGDWGLINEKMQLKRKEKFWFMRGAFSINASDLIHEFADTGVLNWWKEEELTDNQLDDAVFNYRVHKPDVVITHDCPVVIRNTFEDVGLIHEVWGFDMDWRSRTQSALQLMWNYHKPKLWIFGHWHRYVDTIIEGTRFICLNELEYTDDIDEWLNISNS